MQNKKCQNPSLITGKDLLFNVKNKIYLWYLNKFVAKEDEYYGFVEPSSEWMIMHNKKFWIKPCNEEE